ncbi:asterix [Carabus blaptoides fortunei]
MSLACNSWCIFLFYGLTFAMAPHFQDEVRSCPFNPAHRVRASRMQYHIARCEVHYPGWVACHYNACHRMPQDKLTEHIHNCPDRRIMNWNLDQSPKLATPAAEANNAFNFEYENWMQN